MTLDDAARAELQATFQIELEEHCRALSSTYLMLEKEPEAAERRVLLDTAFRSAHSLKGAARAVALGVVEALAHQMEGILGAARRDDLELSREIFDLLYAAVDALDDPADDHTAPDARLRALANELEAAQTTALQVSLAHASAAPIPAAAPVKNGAVAATHTVLGGPAHAETIRLPAARLDVLLEQLGELVIPRLALQDGMAGLATLRGGIEAWQREWRKVRPQLRQLEHDGVLASLRPLVRFLERNETNLNALVPQLAALQDRLTGPTSQLGSITDDLQADVKRFRMLPFGYLGDSLERAVRDLARSLDKEVRLVLVGSDTELDRRALEEIKDPLLHLLRNALDHGIESPIERQRCGKPAIASVIVAAAQRGSTIVIEVEDDGAGISPEAIRAAALERGMVSDGDLAAMNDAAVLRLIFVAGFSTRDGVSELSGRGVGLDVVARNVEHLGGRVDVESTPGRGTRFVMTLPLTLASARALLVEAGGALYALPMAVVKRVLRPARLGSLGGRAMLEYDGAAIPVISLAALLASNPDLAPADSATSPTLAIIAAGTQRVAIVIDRVVGEQEIVVKPLPFPVLRLRYLAGVTILGSGSVVAILNAADLVWTASKSGPTQALARSVEPTPRRQRVLVADDSLTTRTLERYILEAAGYEVELAGDGAEALALLQEKGYDLLVSDVDMPALDGVALTLRLRTEPKLRDLPVILVTSLESATDRERGLQAGADAYIVKSSFDQDQLLRTIRDLV